VLDNHDSFVYNLARYARELGCDAVVRMSDSITVSEVAAMQPSHIILSPGPCTPAESGLCTDVARELGTHVPILGVCLGHQCIAAAFGGKIVRAQLPLHGRSSAIYHDGTGVLAGIPSPFLAARYHSLVIDLNSLPGALRVTARSEEGEIMAVAHERLPVYGVQFHPESVATEWGYQILANFFGVSRNDVPRTADWGRAVVTAVICQ
jgi:anthranilate synthase/aminodeoxychorismate synthase-like glutamine amidotransferase